MTTRKSRRIQLAVTAGFLFIFASGSIQAANFTTISDGNGTYSDDTADLVALAISEPNAPGMRMLAWADHATNAVYAQLIDAENQPMDIPMLQLGNPQTTFSSFIPPLPGRPGRTLQYRVITGASGLSRPGQPTVIYNADRNHWLVAWPVNLQRLRDNGTSWSSVGYSLIGRIVSPNFSGGLELGPVRHLIPRYTVDEFDNEHFAHFGSVLEKAAYAIVHDPRSSRYFAMWSGATETTHQVYICPLNETTLSAGSECNGDPVDTDTSYGGNSWRMAANLDATPNPSEIHVAYSSVTNNTDTRTYIKKFKADFSNLTTAPRRLISDGRFNNAGSVRIHHDTAQDRHLVLMGFSNDAGQDDRLPSVASVPASGSVQTTELLPGTAGNGQPLNYWQPNMLYAPDVDAYFMINDDGASGENRGGVYWSAFDAGFAPGDVQQTSYRLLPIFRRTLSTYDQAISKSALTRYDDRHIAVIGISASGDRISTSTRVPFTVDLGVTLNDIDDDGTYFRGDVITLPITIDNRVPESGIPNLSVAKNPELRLQLGTTDLEPDFGDICTGVTKVGAQWRCSLQDPPTADGLLQADVQVPTNDLTVPASGLNFNIIASVWTNSTDPVSTNNSASISVTFLPVTDLVLQFSGASDAISIPGGESFEIPYTLRNMGENPATGITLSIELPEGVSLQEAQGCTPDGTEGVIHCSEISDIANGAETTVNLTFSTSAVSEDVVSQVVSSVESATEDSNNENNIHHVDLTRTPVIVDPPTTDLALDLSGGDNGIGIVGGDGFALEFVIANQGESEAADVVLSIVLPDGVELDTTTGCTPSGTTGEVNCPEIGNISAGESASVSMTFITGEVAEETTDQLTASVASSTADADSANNAYQFTVVRVPVGVEPVDPPPVDPPPVDPPASGGGGGTFGFGLLAALIAIRRFQAR